AHHRVARGTCDRPPPPPCTQLKWQIRQRNVFSPAPVKPKPGSTLRWPRALLCVFSALAFPAILSTIVVSQHPFFSQSLQFLIKFVNAQLNIVRTRLKVEVCPWGIGMTSYSVNAADHFARDLDCRR